MSIALLACAERANTTPKYATQAKEADDQEPAIAYFEPDFS